MNLYNVTMTATSARDERELGIFALRVTYQFYAENEQDAKRRAKRFDSHKRIISVCESAQPERGEK